MLVYFNQYSFLGFIIYSLFLTELIQFSCTFTGISSSHHYLYKKGPWEQQLLFAHVFDCRRHLEAGGHRKLDWVWARTRCVCGGGGRSLDSSHPQEHHPPPWRYCSHCLHTKKQEHNVMYFQDFFSLLYQQIETLISKDQLASKFKGDSELIMWLTK